MQHPHSGSDGMQGTLRTPSRDATICLPLKHHDRREYRTIPRNGHRHCRLLCVVSRRADVDVDGLLSDELKRALGVHQKEDRRLVHV